MLRESSQRFLALQVDEAEIHDINKLKKKARANAGFRNKLGKGKAAAAPQTNIKVCNLPSCF